MDPVKSQVEFYLDLVVSAVQRDPLNVTSPKSLRRDVQTLLERTRSEGLSFLTKTLPKLGKALDEGLIVSHFSIPREFKPSHGSRSIPAFLQAYFKCVFDECGDLLDGANSGAVEHLRQILFFLYKLELPYKSLDEERVISGFIQTEKELEFGSDVMSEAILAAASYITRDVFAEFDSKDILPRHGPGAVATGEKLDDKWEFSRLYRGLHQVYPYYEYFVVGGARELIDRLGWYKRLERLDQGRAKVVLVPKDSRGPRLISCEPLEFQWIQQGLGRKIMGHLESHRLTKGNINFTDQSVNQRLALESSLTNENSTLDLKDASDRVSLALVRKVFQHTPDLLRALEASRTSSTLLPNGEVLELNKFAPMGSALCFPIEAFCFWVLIVATLSRELRQSPSLVGKRVFVYGDDLVVPREWAHASVQALERFALKVNVTKCCITGPFRESCGTDAFKGHKVTPLRCKTQWTGRSSDGSAYVSYVALANAMSAKGYHETASFLWKKLESVYGRVAAGTDRSSFPCRVFPSPEEAEAYNAQKFRSRVSGRYQRTEFFVIRTKVRKAKTKLDDWTRLLRNQVSGRIDDPQTIVIPRSMQIKRGWAAVY